MAQQPIDPYEHKEFPKMVYSSTGASMVVNSEDEFAEFRADGWSESPADHGFIETADPAEKQRKQLEKDRAERDAKIRAQREAQAAGEDSDGKRRK
jgi:hypothetical protein